MDKIIMFVYMKDGNVHTYEVDSSHKAREHAYAIWQSGFRVKIGTRHEWFGPHWIDKICWDGTDNTYLAQKYDE